MRTVFSSSAAAVLVSAAALQAQERWITIQNLTPFARKEWASTVVPFPRGAVKTAPAMRIGKLPTVWQPIGARWDDGSVRQAVCMFPVELNRMSEVLLPLKEGASPPLPNPKIIDPVRTGAAKVSLRITIGGKASTAPVEFVSELEHNAARTVSLYRCRVGKTGFVFEWIVTAYAGQEHCAVSLGLFFSDPTSKAMQTRVQRATLTTVGMRATLRHDKMFSIRTKNTATGSDLTVLENVVVGNGQGIRRVGVLTPTRESEGASDEDKIQEQTFEAAKLLPVLAATPWRGTDAYGPFGLVPEAPPWLRGNRGRSALARRHGAFVAQSQKRGHPFRHLRFGLAKDPGATGSQEDFGILKLSPVASTGIPSFLAEVEPSILQEACRPVHNFESDGSPIRTANHPDWVTWSGRTHWNCEVSKDRLGKPCPRPKYETHGWQGKDRQHGSSNYLCGYYLLTGSHWARRQIENEVQLFLAGQTIRDGIATSTSGAPRAAGRMLLLGCWLYQCTGDKDLLARMHARMEKSYLPHWFGREFPKENVRAYAVRPARSGQLGKRIVWKPWEDAIAATGFAAFYRLTGDAVALRLAEEISLNVVRHGWLVEGRRVQVGFEILFQHGGKPLTRAQTLDRSLCGWAGGGIGEWSLPAVVIARHFAKEREDGAALARADRILRAMRAGRNRPPRDGWWDAYREWDAVRVGR